MSEIVELYMYDIGNNVGILLGEDGIWHTSIVVHGYELSYNSSVGIQICKNPGNPTKIEKLGNTAIAWKQLEMYVNLLSTQTYRKCDYKMLKNNCNNFSAEIASFLCGSSISSDILDLPQRAVGKGLLAGATVGIASSSSSSSCIII